MAADDLAGYVSAGLSAWAILVLANTISEWSAKLKPIGARQPGTPCGTHRKVYAEFYWGLVLPVVAGTALFGVLLKRPAFDDLEWWGAVFFILYYAVQHTRREDAAIYGKLSLAVDIAGIGVFFAVMKTIGLFDQGSGLSDHPKLLFSGALSIPVLGGISRLLSNRRPRFVLSAVATGAASLGLFASWRGWAPSFRGCMMAILIVIVVAYFVGNVLEDGGERQVSAKWLR